jgi:hypothetical protein
LFVSLDDDEQKYTITLKRKRTDGYYCFALWFLFTKSQECSNMELKGVIRPCPANYSKQYKCVESFC